MSTSFPSKDWSAWLNTMPGSERTLHVTGTVTCPNPGYKAELVPSSPQGFNPEIYLLDLVVTPPCGGDGAADVLEDVPVDYREVTHSAYSDVTIMPENITVPVEIIS